jgi:hypothetical protein
MITRSNYCSELGARTAFILIRLICWWKEKKNEQNPAEYANLKLNRFLAAVTRPGLLDPPRKT